MCCAPPTRVEKCTVSTHPHLRRSRPLPLLATYLHHLLLPCRPAQLVRRPTIPSNTPSAHSPLNYPPPSVVPPGTAPDLAVTVVVDGRESLVTKNARAMLSYRQPVVFAVNVTWASEGSPVSVLGRDFSNTSHVLCRTGSTQRASYGTYVSPTHVTCPLGTSRENAADASVPFDLFVSNDDGLRWTSNLSQPVRLQRSARARACDECDSAANTVS